MTTPPINPTHPEVFRASGSRAWHAGERTRGWPAGFRKLCGGVVTQQGHESARGPVTCKKCLRAIAQGVTLPPPRCDNCHREATHRDTNGDADAGPCCGSPDCCVMVARPDLLGWTREALR